MAILSLDHYNRRFITRVTHQLVYHTTKGPQLIVTGMIIGVRTSHDGRKIRCILNDEINKVFTLTNEDFKLLMDNSISVSKAVQEGLMDDPAYDKLRHDEYGDSYD